MKDLFLVLYLCNKKGLRTKFCLWPSTITRDETMAPPPPPPPIKILDPPLLIFDTAGSLDNNNWSWQSFTNRTGYNQMTNHHMSYVKLCHYAILFIQIFLKIHQIDDLITEILKLATIIWLNESLESLKETPNL